jgi:hypothetical protein
MAGSFTDYWRLVTPAQTKSKYEANATEAAKLYSNFSWYTKVMKGASSRFSKYTQYKNMDGDVFVTRALDTIAEEMTHVNTRTGLPFDIDYQNENNTEVPESITMTVRAALRHWSDVQDLDKILYDIARITVKFGDCFFQKTSDFKKWKYIDPNDIIGISIDKDGNPDHYHVRSGEKNKQGAFGDVSLIPAAGIVHFSLSSSMGENGPFGESPLWSCIKAYRHLSLLEDSVIIYRIVRAPERRVFFVDVGNMPPQRVKAYLESIKTEMKQKRIPNETGGTDKIDSVYNPMSMTEDYFFAQTAEGRGSKVETLSGGENLGEITDLTYFQNKFLQGLRIPSSYMRGGQDGGSVISDGKVGIAYIEELRFANFISRLQSKINSEFDKQFKCYLASAGIKIDENLFKIKLPDPQNFKIYRQAEIDEKMISNYGNMKDVKELSARFKLQRFLGLSEDDLQENEVMIKQELGIPEGGIDEGLSEIRMIYDPKWIENRPDIKVPETFDDHTGVAGESEDSTESEEETEVEDSEGKSDIATSSKEPKEKEPEDKVEEPDLDTIKKEVSK